MKMYIKRYGMFFNCQCVTLVILIVLITACDACPRRSPPPQRRPTPRTTPPQKRTPPRKTTSPTKHTQEPTIATKKTSESGSETSSMPPTTTIKTPTHSGTRQPDQSYHFCFSTTFESLTIDIIRKELSDLGKAGSLTDSFNGSDGERIVFLKWMPPNNTNCSDIKGYIINITRRNNNYTFGIKDLEKELAEKNCERSKNCFPFQLSVPTNKASENTKPTEPSKTTQPEEQNASQETSSEQPPGPTVAERSDDKSGVSSTTIGIPVAVVVVLVIVVTISVCWFKRRSKSKGYKEEKTENSANHMVGPLGDLYTIANPNAEKERNGKDENNDLVYTELSHMKSRNEESVEEQPESDQPDYADITHILKAGETTYENVAFQSEKDTYANVVALQ